MQAKRMMDEQAVPHENQVLMVTPDQLTMLKQESKAATEVEFPVAGMNRPTFMGVKILTVPTKDMSSIPHL